MRINDSLLVPILNGQSYSPKPPLFFWLILLFWRLFGSNIVAARILPFVFALGNIFLLHLIGLQLWPNDKKTAFYAPVLLSSTLIWNLWASLIMFDMILSFWVLMGVLGVILVFRSPGWAPCSLLAIAIAGGILTKGPVIFVHVVPVLLFAPWWNREKRLPRKWYVAAFVALFAGAVCSLAWAVPAAIRGGEDYRNAIFFGQTFDRVVSSFAHRRNLLFYLPFLPLMLFPWCYFKPCWTGFRSATRDDGKRFCLAWFFSSLIVLSLISGKQFYYLLPEIPALILLFSKGIASTGEPENGTRAKPVVIGTMICIAGCVLCLEPIIMIAYGADYISIVLMLFGGLGSIGVGIFLLRHSFKSQEKAVIGSAFGSILLLVMLLIGERSVLKRFDLSQASRIIGQAIDDGIVVANEGRYRGEYHFLGGLRKPIVILKTEEESIKFVNDNPDGLVISHTKTRGQSETRGSYYNRPYRRTNLVVWRAKDYLDHMDKYVIENESSPKAIQ